jgi:hypothetical protein
LLSTNSISGAISSSPARSSPSFFLFLSEFSEPSLDVLLIDTDSDISEAVSSLSPPSSSLSSDRLAAGRIARVRRPRSPDADDDDDSFSDTFRGPAAASPSSEDDSGVVVVVVDAAASSASRLAEISDSIMREEEESVEGRRLLPSEVSVPAAVASETFRLLFRTAPFPFAVVVRAAASSPTATTATAESALTTARSLLPPSQLRPGR